MDNSGWKKVGHIGVDAGLCWVGDPCYILHNSKTDKPKTIGKNWNDFCNILFKDDMAKGAKSFPYELGHEGLGVVVSTGCGDGTYPVYIKKDRDGTVMGVMVDFMGLFGDNDEEDDDGQLAKQR